MMLRFLVVGLLLTLLVGCAASPDAVAPTPQPTPALVFETVLPPGTIQPLDHPATITGVEARAALGPYETVMGLSIGGAARAYPLGLLSRHEIANDTLGGEPIVVTFCPNCNVGLATSRVVTDSNGAATTLTFGVSGKLLDTALVMQDRETNTLWSQSRLVAVEGALAGTTLRLLTVTQTTWDEWRAAHPNTELVIDERARAAAPANVQIPLPGLPQPGTGAEVPNATTQPTGYVLGVAAGQTARAFPLEQVAAAHVVNDEVAGVPPFVIVALDAPGAVAAWQRALEGQTLTFQWDGSTLRDDQTRSEWNPRTGAALSGPLAGAQLQPLDVSTMHWLGWQNLYPNTEVWLP